MAGLHAKPFELVSIRLPVWWTFGALVAGLFVGLALADTALLDRVVAVSGPVGTLWLRALQMTIIPLVAALLVLGISQMAQAAKAGAVARRMLLLVVSLLLMSGLVSAVFMPALLAAFPIPEAASAMLLTGEAEVQRVPGIGDFVASLLKQLRVFIVAEINVDCA